MGGYPAEGGGVGLNASSGARGHGGDVRGRVITITSETRDAPTSDWIMVGLLVAAIAYLASWLDWPWIFDIFDPAFNPLLILMGLLALATVRFASRLGVAAIRFRRQGVSMLEIEGGLPLRIGSQLSARFKFTHPIVPRGEYRITLACYDVHIPAHKDEHGESSSRRREYLNWNEQQRIPQSVSASGGLPIEFKLPTSVGPRPTGRRKVEQRESILRKFALLLPGYRRAFGVGAPPTERAWRLTVTVPTRGINFRAVFLIPVHEG